MASQQGPVKGVTATVIAGPVGASFSVYEENWKCPCGQQNYARRTK